MSTLWMSCLTILRSDHAADERLSARSLECVEAGAPLCPHPDRLDERRFRRFVGAPSHLRQDPDRQPEVGLVFVGVLAKDSFSDRRNLGVELYQRDA
jgi:hypothetical protein